MAKQTYIVLQTLRLEFQADNLDKVISWLENATTFDLLDKGAAGVAETITTADGYELYDSMKSPARRVPATASN